MAEPLRILTVVGARPQFIKAAALSRAISGAFAGRIHQTLLHTGQHYDADMSAVFFQELGLQAPQVHLGSTLAGRAHIGRMMAGVERNLEQTRPDLVLVYGDTNSTLAGAMAACRMGIAVAHVEAGLRSYENSMPEEENRVLTDHGSTWLFCPTATAVANLAVEGIAGCGDQRPLLKQPVVVMTGDVMLDNTLYYVEHARKRPVLEHLSLRNRPYIVATVHRSGTADDSATLHGILTAFAAIHASTGAEVVLPLHPRTARALPLDEGIGKGIRIISPLGYLDMLALVDGAQFVITDSGGLQKEACFLGKRCLVLRERTEWVELLENGGVLLVGTDPDRILAGAQRMAQDRILAVADAFGDGHAAERICTELLLHR